MARPDPICREGEMTSQSQGVETISAPAVNKSAVFKWQSVTEFLSNDFEISRIGRARGELSRGIWHAPIRS